MRHEMTRISLQTLAVFVFIFSISCGGEISDPSPETNNEWEIGQENDRSDTDQDVGMPDTDIEEDVDEVPEDTEEDIEEVPDTDAEEGVPDTTEPSPCDSCEDNEICVNDQCICEDDREVSEICSDNALQCGETEDACGNPVNCECEESICSEGVCVECLNESQCGNNEICSQNKCHCDEGFEGPSCEPIDLCDDNPCDPNAHCSYTPPEESYTCECSNGYVGDGISCEPESCELPWGGEITHGAEVEAYSMGEVECEGECISETRACSYGELSGSYTHESCAAPCSDCEAQPLTWDANCSIEEMPPFPHGHEGSAGVDGDIEGYLGDTVFHCFDGALEVEEGTSTCEPADLCELGFDSCSPDETCTATGPGEYICECKPATCGDAECGTVTNSCGNTTSCGECGEGMNCETNQCICEDDREVSEICSDNALQCGETEDACGNPVNCECPGDGSCDAGMCYDLENDPDNCEEVGNSCGDGDTCNSGECCGYHDGFLDIYTQADVPELENYCVVYNLRIRPDENIDLSATTSTIKTVENSFSLETVRNEYRVTGDWNLSTFQVMENIDSFYIAAFSDLATPVESTSGMTALTNITNVLWFQDLNPEGFEFFDLYFENLNSLGEIEIIETFPDDSYICREDLEALCTQTGNPTGCNDLSNYTSCED